MTYSRFQSKIKYIFPLVLIASIAYYAGLKSDFSYDSVNRSMAREQQGVIHQASPTPSPALTKWGVLAIIQEWRLKNNLPEYRISDSMCRIADKRLDQIKVNFSHDGFYADDLCDRWCSIAENLAEGASSGFNYMLAWERSASHSANLKKDYTHTCVATDGDYIVHIFGYY